MKHETVEVVFSFQKEKQEYLTSFAEIKDLQV